MCSRVCMYVCKYVRMYGCIIVRGIAIGGADRADLIDRTRANKEDHFDFRKSYLLPTSQQ
jgi:hypothetical protein